MRRCGYTRRWADDDVHDVAIRLGMLWTVIVDTAPASAFDDGVLVDDRLLDWVAAAGRCRLSGRTP